jgi:hypothetical protein
MVLNKYNANNREHSTSAQADALRWIILSSWYWVVWHSTSVSFFQMKCTNFLHDRSECLFSILAMDWNPDGIWSSLILHFYPISRTRASKVLDTRHTISTRLKHKRNKAWLLTRYEYSTRMHNDPTAKNTVFRCRYRAKCYKRNAIQILRVPAVRLWSLPCRIDNVLNCQHNQ